MSPAAKRGPRTSGPSKLKRRSTPDSSRPPQPAVLALQLLGQWNRIAGGHVALSAGCSCGVAVPGVRVQDFEEQILEYLQGRHGGSWKKISDLLAGIARGTEPAGAAMLEDLQRTFESFEQQHSGR
jgi:hypothetical protein